MKKLVKTAKQQFEERLSELNVFNHQSLDLNETFYCGLNSDNQFIMLLNDGDANYMESGFIDEYEAVVTSEKFLSAMIERFNEGKREIKPLFDWYASADHEITESSPLDLRDLFNLGIEEAFYQFEDLYEEVPDVRIITAKEQWEEASKNAREIPSHKGCTCKFEENEEGLTFYIYHFDSYESYHFPSFDELRKDGNFVSAYIGIVQKLHPEDLAYAIQWLTDGKYNMADVTLWDIKEALEGYEDEHIFFSDKVLSQEQSIEKKVFLPEIHELRDRMVEHIAQLCEKGMTIDFDSLLDCSFLLWDDMSYILPEDLSNFWLAKDKYGVWKAYRSGDGSCEYDLYDLSIYTLQHIINCLC